MSLCDMCGIEECTLTVRVEGVDMRVCDKCAKFGKVISKIERNIERQKDKPQQKIVPDHEIIQQVVPDFASRIKAGRELSGLKQEDFAKIIAERESVLHNLESGKIKPSMNLAKKLEKALHIILIETIEVKKEEVGKVPRDGLTIGDILK